MKRFWIGLGLLLALLGAGLWSMAAMERVHSAISIDLQQSARAAQQDDWMAADEFAASAAGDWKDGWHFSAALADHSSLEQIDALFAQLEVYRKNREPLAYAATCAQLAQLIEALHEGHRLSWWNLL